MPFLQNAQDVHINNSDFRDIQGDYVENVVTNRRGRGRDRTITEVGGNHYDFSNLNGNGRPHPTPQPTSTYGGNNVDSRHMSRSSRNNTYDDDDLYIGAPHVPPAGERRDGGHNGQAGTSNVNPAGSINFTRRVSTMSSSKSGKQSPSVDPAGAQIDFMNGGSSGGALLINNSTFAVAGRSIRTAVTSRHTQAPLSQVSPASGHEDGDRSFTGRYRDPTSYRTETGGGVTRGSMVSESPVPRASTLGSQATLDDETSPSSLSTNIPRPEVSINEALKEPPSKKDAGFLGF